MVNEFYLSILGINTVSRSSPLSQLTWKRVTEQKEDKIVNLLVKQKQTIEPSTLSKMLGGKKEIRGSIKVFVLDDFHST
jgi:hypothetical protein